MLNSWKEIAAYLDRGVRTAQRWELELGLPVRRPRHHSRTAVVALKSDLDQWLHNVDRPANGNAAVQARSDAAQARAILRMNRQEMRTLTKRLHEQMARARGLVQHACEIASKSDLQSNPIHRSPARGLV